MRRCSIKSNTPPVILLGGTSNTLSLARSFSRKGIKVYSLNLRSSPVCYSRYCNTIVIDDNKRLVEELWTEFLLSKKASFLHGSVILSCCDSGIETVIKHYNELSYYYILENYNLDIQPKLLDKLSTYKLAQESGILTPSFWEIDPRSDIRDIINRVSLFPVLLKPRISHHFRRHFNRKFFIANNRTELSIYLEKIKKYGIEVILMELIPGPDSKSGSYYTYIDTRGNFLFHYTKKQLRRYPVNMGPATYHITTKDEEVIELGSTFFKKIGFKGLGNIEFKKDDRDGKYKLIECNARFTEGTKLLIKSGLEIGLIVYYNLLNQAYPIPQDYSIDIRLWDPINDFRAFMELKDRKEITLKKWIRSIAYKHYFPIFSYDDPFPWLMCRLDSFKYRIKRFF